MNRRCALFWALAVIALAVAAISFYRGGFGGADGVFLVSALACALLGIQAHQTVGSRV